MQENPLVLIIAAEVGVALLLVLAFLFVHIRGLRRIISALESKVIALRDTLKGARRETNVVREQLAQQAHTELGYGEMLDTLIAATRNHHLTLGATRDIVLDIDSDAPIERQAVALRHAFLIAEKEAWMAAEGKEVDWPVLQAKLGQIIQFYSGSPEQSLDEMEAISLDSDVDVDPASNPENTALRETIENQKRHIENLEKFKKLFFAADEKWRAASEEAAQYHRDLLAKGRDLGGDADFDGLLNKYSQVYSDFGVTLANSIHPEPTTSIEVGSNQPSVGRLVIANQEEIQRLRNMAVDQHKMIVKLRDELNAAHSIEEKDRVIAELHKQLERHERFLKESEICTKQLEEELDRAMDESHALKQKLRQAKQEAQPPEPAADVEHMAKLIEDFTVQSSEMLTAIDVLESECRELRRQLAAVGAADMDTLKRELAEAQQQLANLHIEHVELEERYLELKVKTL